MFDFYVIGFCPYKYCNYFCSKYFDSHDLLDAFIRNWANYSIDNIPAAINDTGNKWLGGVQVQPENNSEYYNWNKVVITSATISAFISYYLIIFFVLIPVYTKCCFCLRGQHDSKCMKNFCTSWSLAFKKENNILLPFCDTGNQSTNLSGIQQTFFLFFYCLNLLFYVTSLVVFIIIMVKKLRRTEVTSQLDKDINETGLVCQFLAQFCAIQSCFIFSKVAYGISNKCTNLYQEFKKYDQLNDNDFRRYLWFTNKLPDDHDNDQWPSDNNNFQVPNNIRAQLQDLQPLSCLKHYNVKIFRQGNNQQEEENQHEEENQQAWERLTEDATFFTNEARFDVLKVLDKAFIKKAKATITPYSLWFAVHWLLYSITTFMSMSLVVETYIRYIYTKHSKSWRHADPDNVLSFSYITLFSITHSFLFIYPCFRAAYITSSRNDVIKKFANHKWKYLPVSIQNAFYHYLVAQDFGFKISLFCAKITFGFNLAFVSIFIGIIGIITKLSL